MLTACAQAEFNIGARVSHQPAVTNTHPSDFFIELYAAGFLTVTTVVDATTVAIAGEVKSALCNIWIRMVITLSCGTVGIRLRSCQGI